MSPLGISRASGAPLIRPPTTTSLTPNLVACSASVPWSLRFMLTPSLVDGDHDPGQCRADGPAGSTCGQWDSGLAPCGRPDGYNNSGESWS